MQQGVVRYMDSGQSLLSLASTGVKASWYISNPMDILRVGLILTTAITGTPLIQFRYATAPGGTAVDISGAFFRPIVGQTPSQSAIGRVLYGNLTTPLELSIGNVLYVEVMTAAGAGAGVAFFHAKPAPFAVGNPSSSFPNGRIDKGTNLGTAS